MSSSAHFSCILQKFFAGIYEQRMSGNLTLSPRLFRRAFNKFILIFFLLFVLGFSSSLWVLHGLTPSKSFIHYEAFMFFNDFVRLYTSTLHGKEMKMFSFFIFFSICIFSFSFGPFIHCLFNYLLYCQVPEFFVRFSSKGLCGLVMGRYFGCLLGHCAIEVPSPPFRKSLWLFRFVMHVRV